MPGSIIAVHRDRALRAVARDALSRAGYGVQEADELEAAWPSGEKPDLVLIPWSASKPVLEALMRLKDEPWAGRTRAIVWAPQPEIRDAVTALELGADDCLGIPFEPAELVARVNACLRRPPAALDQDRLSAGPVVLDKAVHCVTVGGEAVELAPTEFRLLAFLLENQSRAFSRDELLRRAWRRHVKAGRRTVDVYMRRLRQVLEPHGCEAMIQTVRGVGYRFEPRSAASSARPRALAVNAADRL